MLTLQELSDRAEISDIVARAKLRGTKSLKLCVWRNGLAAREFRFRVRTLH